MSILSPLWNVISAGVKVGLGASTFFSSLGIPVLCWECLGVCYIWGDVFPLVANSLFQTERSFRSLLP